MKARYFKIESFGTVDGPGTRMVLFLQGCNLRCKYCHNPESWDLIGDSKEISVEEVIESYEKNLTFYKNGGGITISGGEPWMHIDFLIALAKICQEKQIHLTIDTAAYFFNDKWKIKNDKLINLVDLWLIDIKHINPKKYKSVTGLSEEKQHEKLFIQYLEKIKKPYWVRQVLVPGLTDEPSDLEAIGTFISNLKFMQKFEILPYHKLMLPKYQNLNLPLPLPKVNEPSDEDVRVAKELILKGIKKNKIQSSNS